MGLPPPYIIGFYSSKIVKKGRLQTKANTVILAMLP